MRKFIVAAALAGSAAAPALAQDVVANAAGTGPRIELLLGYDAPKDIKNDVNYGVGVGFDFTALGATAGIEGEYTESDADSRRRDLVAPGTVTNVGLGRDLYVGGRIGAVLIGSSFVYAKAGYTNQRVRASFDTGTSTLPVAANNSTKTDLDGARVGAGIEFGIPTFGFGSSAYVKTEYRYSNYEQGFEKHQGMAGIGFRF